MDNILISRSDISELPATIQEIYELAQQIKQNTDKKANKKKEKKGKGEIKKQIQFVPTF